MTRRQETETGILDLIRREEWDRVATAIRGLHPADIAEVLDSAPRGDLERLFSFIGEDIKPDVLAELTSVAGAEILDSLSSPEISGIVEDMAPDDAADVLADLPDDRSTEILQLMGTEESEDVRELMQYEDDTAGGIMTTDVVAMRENQTVDEALKAIADIDTREPFYYAHLVDRDGGLIGYVDVWTLLREKDRGRSLADIAHRNAISANVDMDQEQVAMLMTRYDLDAIPVVDKSGTLVGRITSDDVFDVIEEEASEDILRLAGSDDAELESASPFRSVLVRLPWLLLTLGGGFVTSYILKQFHALISEILILAAFVPIVLAMGGNTGIQSSTLVVRRIALGDMRGQSVASLLLREVFLGAVMGTICGVIIGMWAHFLIARHNPALSAGHLGLVVALALFSAMTFAATFGALVPVLLNRFRIDPAVASGPFITIANDISALLIYFSVTTVLVQKLAAM